MVAVAIAGSACNRTVKQTEIPPPSTADTSLGPGDVFKVRVFGEDSLSAEYRVAQDGSINFPLIGRVAVAGLEPTQIADLIQRRLKEGEFLHDPHVSIYVEEYESKRVSVVGAVANPGAFPLKEGMTVVQAISMAGGFTELADRNATLLTRRVGGKNLRFRIPADRVAQGDAEDVELGPGDIIFVPQRLF